VTADVVVIGAGFAGLSAAVDLAAAGKRVVVVEEAPRLGGRATAFTDRETGERVDNGQHVLFGCYRETYAFLRRLETDQLVPLQMSLSLPMADTSGRLTRLECPQWLRAPLHLAGGVLRWRALPLADRWSAIHLARPLLASRRRGAAAVAADVPPEETVAGWLRRYRQSDALCEWLWYPLAIAALNESPHQAAAAPFVRVLCELFGPGSADSAIGLPIAPLDEIYAEPARRYIEARGGAVLTRSSARVAVDGGAVRGVRTAGETIEATSVISTVPWHAIGRLWDSGPPALLAPMVTDAARHRSSPIVSVNLWVDGPVTGEQFVGLVGGPFHWLFDKGAILDRAPDRRGHIALVASGALDLVNRENTEVTERAMSQLRRTFPRMAERTVRRSVVVREHRATFSVAPGGPPRPPATTALAGFYLAGDWTDTGLPGTIEGAVASGHRASRLVLNR
jgi:zeta-carotene desaturase